MKPADLRFRTAVPGDAAALGEFMARNFLATYGHCSTPENVQAAIDEHYGEPAQLRQISAPDRHNLIAVQGEDWVGHAQLHLGSDAPANAGSPRAVELSRFYVDSRFQGKGVAQAMMAQVKAYARANGAASLWLSVWQEATQAVRFYAKEGFTITGEMVFIVGADPKDDWLMVCELGEG